MNDSGFQIVFICSYVAKCWQRISRDLISAVKLIL